MSLFGDLDLNEAADDPFAVPDGTYEGVVSKCTAGPTKNGDKNGMTFTYELLNEDGGNAGSLSEWKQIPDSMDTEDGRRQASYLKARLLSLGVARSDLNTVTPDELIGAEVIVKVKNTEKNGVTYCNVQSVEINDGKVANSGNEFANLS